MLPPAPPTFSMTTVWPSGARIASAMMRAVVSVEPPGGNGEISVTGRVGKDLRSGEPGKGRKCGRNHESDHRPLLVMNCQGLQ